MQTTTSTPTGIKLTSYQSHSSNFNNPSKILPSSLSTHTKHHIEQSFNSINSRI